MKRVSLGNEISTGRSGRSESFVRSFSFKGLRMPLLLWCRPILAQFRAGIGLTPKERQTVMAKAKKLTLAEKSDDVLRSELGTLQAVINGKQISWENAKGELRACPYSVFSHTGKLLVGQEDDADLWDSGTAVLIRVEAERRNGGSMVSVRASHAVKAGLCSATVRTSGMKSDVSPVTVQLADAQKLQGQARAISAELFRRAEAEAERKAIEAEAAKQTKVTDLVKAAFTGGSITAEEAELLNAELHAEVA